MLHQLKGLWRIIKRRTMFKSYSIWTEVDAILHIGANYGQERDFYESHQLEVDWVEANPQVVNKLKEHIRKRPFQRAYQGLIAEVDGRECDFYISNNAGESSSIYDFGEHKKIWADVYFNDKIRLKTVTLGRFLNENKIKLRSRQGLVMDVQAAEHLVLRGAGDLIRQFRWIKTEAADFELYQGGAQLYDLESILIPLGFQEIEREIVKRVEGLGTCYNVIYRKVN